jgi:hypothetical protein
LKTLKVQKERLDYKMVSNALRQCKTWQQACTWAHDVCYDIVCCVP